jgi:ectoine hydroxylase-related dioxygenase (phytanoyl-CoA dioxygenase family)
VLTDEDIARFHTDGYIVVADVLTQDQVAELRRSVRPLFEESGTASGPNAGSKVVNDVLSVWPRSREMVFAPEVLSAVRSLLGEDAVLLAESAAHLQAFGGWHRDTTSQERAGLRFHDDDDYLMVELAFYLQDNTEQNGGGLTVLPGSHRALDERRLDAPDLADPQWWSRLPKPVATVAGKLRFRLRDLRSALRTRAGREDRAFRRRRHAVRIPSRAGDLVIFDFRIVHHATPHRGRSVPQNPEKLAVFFACSRANEHVANYYRFLLGRPDYGWLRDWSAPGELVAEAERNGIRLAMPPAEVTSGAS